MVVFVSVACDLDALAVELQRSFGPIPVVGSTTAGEISPTGYSRGTAVGFSLAAPDFAAAVIPIYDLRSFTVAAGEVAMSEGLRLLRHQVPHASLQQLFGILLIDGLSLCEEAVASALRSAMGEIPMCGGSAGDSMRFERTLLLHDGTWHSGAALLTLVATPLPFHVFKNEHFIPGDERMVVTGADVSRRIVTEINGYPAVREYARMVGLAGAPLTPMVFAQHPVVVRIGGSNYVRSIQKANDDESLSFYCAIDEGVVLRLAHGVDPVDDLGRLFADLRKEVGPPALTVGFDCILRSLEMDRKGIRDRIGSLMAANNVIGFASYGEQFEGMHVNQTFTGVAIGRPG